MVRGAAVTTLAAMLGCTELCTLLPCFGGLLINLDRSPDTGTIIEVTASGTAPVIVDCDTESCWPLLHLPDVMAQRVTVRVTSATGSTSSEFDLNYVTSELNGSGCGTCTSAEISVSVP